MGLQDISCICNRVGCLSGFKFLLFLFCVLFAGSSFSALKDDAFPNDQAPIKPMQGVSIQADSNGHYRGTLLINNVAMPFLIDTGATHIVVPTRMAYSARLPLGKAVQSSTANGLVVERLTHINSLKIGDLEIRNLDASTTGHLNEVLVGMDFLKLFRMVQDRNVLTLILSSGVVANAEIIPVVPVLSKQPNIKDELIKEKSGKAYMNAQNEVADFKAQYVKPTECYDIKDNTTRMRCANAFIKAREAYEALNK